MYLVLIHRIEYMKTMKIVNMHIMTIVEIMDMVMRRIMNMVTIEITKKEIIICICNQNDRRRPHPTDSISIFKYFFVFFERHPTYALKKSSIRKI
jgi:hypothetical protein